MRRKAREEPPAKYLYSLGHRDIVYISGPRYLSTENEHRGLLIPDDVSIIGYDDIPFSSAISLTTISQPAYEMGRNAMHLLIDLMEKHVSTPHHIVLRPSIIIRKSCQKM
ncbi:MAG: substrate-binding domain-containing protein [Spirochaetes bacterium]|nr:substrate-binding domain-containing protein [Spirochaetota bacterium]